MCIKKLFIVIIIIGLASLALGQGGNWSEPVLVDSINWGYHDGYPSISPDGQTMYLAKGNDIWAARWNGESWGTPVILNENINLGQVQVGATVTPDNRTLYFTSYRDNGYGSYDIWKSDWDDSLNDWGEAEVLPPPINTDHMECDVQLSYDGTKMYLSSNRDFSWGDLDIWCSDWDSSTQTWGEPVNLGTTINTSTRENGPYPSLDGRRLYFSSWNRHGLLPPQWQDPPEIFVAYNNNGAWDSLDVLTEINSDYWDESPALSWDGLSLYFASSRNSSDGWRDIYVSHQTTDIQDLNYDADDENPIDFCLYPNPSNSEILFKLGSTLNASSSSLQIYNILGSLVYDISLADKNSIIWNCRDMGDRKVSSGCYFAILKADDNIYKNKFVILK